MKKKLIIVVIILIATVLITKEIFDYLPYFIAGQPLAVFEISNMDSKNHIANVQVLNSNNKFLINETYELGYSQPGQWVQGQYAQYPENGWKSVYDRDKLFPKGNYTFIMTLDNNVIKTFQTELDRGNQVIIRIDNSGNLDVRKIYT